MKTRTKKCGIFVALAAVLLVTAMLVITCVDPVIPGLTIPQEKDTTPIVPPPGKTYIQVTIPANAVRTLMPVAPTTVSYNVAIVSKTAGEDYDNTDGDGDVDFADGTEIFYVEPDEYTVSVSVHSSATPASTNLIAYGEEDIDVTSGGSPTPAIVLKPFVTGSYTGTFTYTLTPNPAGSSVTATYEAYPSGTPAALTTSPMTLPVGYYWVRVALENDPRYAPATYTQILHVYGNQNTSWAPTNLTLNKIRYDVIYNLNYSGAPANVTDTNPPGNTGWPHNQPITKNTAFSTDPLRSDYTFDAWYKNSGGTGSPWVFGNSGDLIYKDTTLYAKWIPDSSLNAISVEIDPYVQPTDQTFFVTKFQEFTLASVNDDSFVITVSAAASGLTIDGWYADDENATKVSSGASFTKGNVLTAIPSYDFSVLGTHTFTFVGTIGGVTYHNEFEVRILE